MTQAVAEAAIANATLTVGTASSAYHATVPAGHVISQQPTAGSNKLPGTAVSLLISDGPEPVSVPDVVGMDQAAAEAAIAAAGLTVTVSLQCHAAVPRGQIISQDPVEGSILPSGSSVSLTVSGAYSGGNGSYKAPFLITTIQDLIDLANPVNSADWCKQFLMTNDIDMAGITGFTPIAPDINLADPNFNGTQFSGVFDGGGHTIRNLVIDLPLQDYVGLFRCLWGTVRNLRIEDSAVTGDWEVGGLVGRNYFGSVMQCYASGVIKGTSRVGGLVGSNYDTVSQCYAKGAITGGNTVGGLVGYNGREIANCYATAMVTGDDEVGGLVGYSYGSVTGSFWDTEASGLAGSFGGKGLTTAQMQTLVIYRNAGWGTSEWVMEDVQYPRLAWEKTGAVSIPAPEPIPLQGTGTEE